MKFIDEATILVEAGHGGSGIKSFYREKFVPLGGPDGGNGGRGGSVILVATANLTTLLDFHFQPRWKATDGLKGQGSRKDGKAGEDLIIKVPVGTQVYKSAGFDENKEPILGDLVCDFDKDGATMTLAQGGRGGKGNSFFKSPTNRAPEHFQPGEEGESGEYVLSLKLVADVGLVGLPNAGKSTLISRISAARPKIADYPFTTLTPNLGVVQAKGGRSFVVADIPGLIPGAHQGKGLGIKFLKHVERTKVIAHLIDPSQLKDDGSPFPPLEAWEAITNELRLFSPEIA
jgi:GTP-binding protein